MAIDYDKEIESLQDELADQANHIVRRRAAGLDTAIARIRYEEIDDQIAHLKSLRAALGI